MIITYTAMEILEETKNAVINYFGCISDINVGGMGVGKVYI